MSGSISPLARCRYGLSRVCSAWAFPRSTFYAQAAPPADPLLPAAKIHAKRGPKTALDDDALLTLIRTDIKDSPFIGEGHRKVHARLHFLAGHKVSRNRVLRLMRVHDLLSPHRTTFAPAKAHDGRFIIDAPNVRWATGRSKNARKHFNTVCAGGGYAILKRPSDAGSSATGLRRTPIFSISISATSPASSQRGGVRAMPTPCGVPVRITVPG